MKRFALVLLASLPCKAALAQERANESSALVYFDPIVFHNMTLVPVATLDPGPHARYTLLEAGLEDKSLSVRELKGSSGEAEVNAVEIKNRGQLAAFLLGGEMILGGKQDRIIQSDTVLPNDGKWHKVAVFCVEQGRWAGRSMEFSGGNAMAHSELRKAAMSGDQGKVWEEVQRKNATHGTSSDTQTYRRTVQNSDLRKKVAHHVSALVSKMPKDEKLAGFVFGINGKIEVADLFGNPILFRDLEEKLVSSYVLAALEKEEVKDAASKLDKKGAEGFLGKARGGTKQSSTSSVRAKTFKKKSNVAFGDETIDEGSGKTLKESYLPEPEENAAPSSSK
ncbi:MAG: hypothetical protein HYV07_26800 [Deltaproteobacteria bacterium]|nr:hypothetical protein [Deltaproteobacteria bacterium]